MASVTEAYRLICPLSYSLPAAVAMARHRRSAAVAAAVCVCLLISTISTCKAAELEGFDDHSDATPVASNIQANVDQAEAFASQTQQQMPDAGPTQPQKKTQKQAGIVAGQHFGKFELAVGVFLVAFAVNYWRGKRANMQIANAWAATFCKQDSIMERNFSLLNLTPDDKLTQEAANVFKFYASGRRHVQGLLATLNLQARQDVISLLWYIVSPTEDIVTFEAYMTEAAMPPLVLAVGTNKAMRKMVNEHRDLAKLTRKIQAPRDSMSSWPNDRLTIHAEHSNVFVELFSEPRVMQALNPNGQNAKCFKYFRSMHFTDEYDEGSHKRVLRFTFALPPASAMSDITPLVALVPLFIDLVGSYKLSPEMKKKAEHARSKAGQEDADNERKARLEALAARKQDKLMEEKARIARLPPAERQKAEEKLQKRMMEKQMRKRTKFG